MKLYSKFLSFCLVGGTGVLIETCFLNFFLFSETNFAFAKSVAILLSISFVFLINRQFTFSAKQGKLKKQLPRYILIYSLAFSVNFFMSLLFKEYLGEGFLNANIASMLGIISAIPISFFGSLFWIFKTKE